MRIQATKPLFVWDSLEDSPTLKTIKQLLEVIPDQTLLDSLRAARGKGRDDVPLHVAWGVLILSIALRHPTVEHCLGELRRNESLRKLIGIDSEDAVPEKWNLSRFLDQEAEHCRRQAAMPKYLANHQDHHAIPLGVSASRGCAGLFGHHVHGLERQGAKDTKKNGVPQER